MAEQENLICPKCGNDTGQTQEEWVRQKAFFLICKKCGTKIDISSLLPGDVLRGYPERVDDSG